MHKQIIRCVSVALLLGTTASCGNQETNAPEPETPSAAAPIKGRGVLCQKLQSAVAETLGITVRTVEAMDDPYFPLRCIYNNEDANGPMFEIQDGATLDKTRRKMEAGGGKISDLPALGAGAFTADYSFMNWVVAAKGDTQIQVAGLGHEFSKLQDLWTKVADAL